MFCDTVVNVTADGRPHFGAPIGSVELIKRFIVDKVDNWISEVDTLSPIVISQPHAAYTLVLHMVSLADGCVHCTVQFLVLFVPET